MSRAKSRYEPLFNELITGKSLKLQAGSINLNSFRTQFYRYKNDAGISKLLKNLVLDITENDDKFLIIKLIKKEEIQFEIIPSEEEIK